MTKLKWVKRLVSIGAGLLLLIIFVVDMNAEVPRTVSYQGHLTNAEGVPVDGHVNMVFSVFSQVSGGTPLWAETQNNIPVSNGIYNVILGKLTPLNLAFDNPYFLEITIGMETLSPRTAITSVGYAFRALQADTVGPHQHSGGNITSGIVLEGVIDPAIARRAEVVSLVNAHALRNDNPHAVTAAQTGSAEAVHSHSASEIISGTLAEARIDSTIARDSEVTTAVNAHATRMDNPHSVTAVQAGAAALVHNHDGIYQKKYAKVAVVAQSGGDYSNPLTAMGALATWCGTPSGSNPCLLKIMPGVYDFASNNLIMQPYVDIEGSGENATILTGNIYNQWVSVGVVHGASNAEIRFLSVRHTGGVSAAVAFFNSFSSAKMTQITAEASGGTNSNAGVFNFTASPTMVQVTAKGSGGILAFGIFNIADSSPVMRDIVASASDASSNYAIDISSGAPVMNQITATASGGQNNYGIYVESAASPTMNQIKATASNGAAWNTAIYNDSSAPVVIQNFYAVAQGGASNCAIENESGSPLLIHGTASASGGNAYGIRNLGASPVISSVFSEGKNGTSNFGIFNRSFAGSPAIKINHSTIRGSSATVISENYISYIGNSQLEGGAVSNSGGSTFICAGVFDENYNFYAGPACP